MHKEGMRSTPESEKPKKRWRVVLEMEAHGKDGSPIYGSELYETVEVEAPDEDAAADIAAEMDWGNRRVSYVDDPIEIPATETKR